mmetsp:Transcript_21924/g.50514  ORF Transcript_21924/g.50514 Transcript_21924/m.50514 type:complete len:576 (-) Transcript_21924:50-1777(-)
MSTPQDEDAAAIASLNTGQEEETQKNETTNQEQQGKPSELRLRNAALSTTSRVYDRDNKGYLDETEELVRSYDKQGEGRIDLASAMDLAHNARAQERKVQQTRTWAIVATIAAVIFALATFGLVWVALILSREVETDGNNFLVNTGSKDIVQTYSHGCLNHFEFIQDVLQDLDSDGDFESLNLQAGENGLALIGYVPETEVTKSYIAIVQDYHVCTAIWTVNGDDEFGRKIDPTDLVREVDADTGDVLYSGIIVTDSFMGEVDVTVKCMLGEERCHVYREIPEGGGRLLCRARRLQGMRPSQSRRRLCCFSSKSSVTVEGKGKINIMDLAVNDRVLSSAGYSTVYAMGDRSSQQTVHVLRIETVATTIELSGNHMVHLANKDLPVLAKSLVVGDELVLMHNEMQETGANTIVKITSVESQGAVTPLTLSGDIVVDGVLASVYAEVGDSGSEYYYHHGDGSILNIHSHVLSHVSLTPLRLACTWVSSSFCTEEYHNADSPDDRFAGSHYFTMWLFHLVEFVVSEECGIFLHIVLFAAIIGSFLFLFLLENFLPIFALVGGAVAFASVSKNRKLKAE